MKGWLIGGVLYGTLMLAGSAAWSQADVPSAQPRAGAIASAQSDLETQKLDLERYKARLDFWKFIWASVFAAIAIALIPPSFQLATAYLEHIKSRAQLRIDQQNKDAQLRIDQQNREAERLAKQEEFRESYIKEFLNNALNQDIELRIRFAEYFAFVSAESFRRGWIDYHKGLVERRKEIREKIDALEADWQRKAQDRLRGSAEIDKLERNLAWIYNEVGYIERDRSVAADPRATAVGPAAHGIALKDQKACASFLAADFKGPATPATEIDYQEVSSSLGVEPAVLRELTQIESGGEGFDDGRPRIRFERHLFHRLTRGQFSASHPDISSAAIGDHGPPGARQYDRLIQAMALDCAAALAATSWGLFQISGIVAAAAGFEYVDEFVTAQMSSERQQLEAGAALINASVPMANALRQKSWARFAELWSGSSSQHQYSARLAAIYARSSLG